MKKRYNLITVVLVIYLAVMSYMGYDTYMQEARYWEFYGIIAATIVVIYFMRKALIKRDAARAKRRREREEGENRSS